MLKKQKPWSHKGEEAGRVCVGRGHIRVGMPVWGRQTASNLSSGNVCMLCDRSSTFFFMKNINLLHIRRTQEI